MIFSQQCGSDDTLFWNTQANYAETQAKSLKTQAYRQLWLSIVVENGRKNKPGVIGPDVLELINYKLLK